MKRSSDDKHIKLQEILDTDMTGDVVWAVLRGWNYDDDVEKRSLLMTDGSISYDIALIFIMYDQYLLTDSVLILFIMTCQILIYNDLMTVTMMMMMIGWNSNRWCCSENDDGPLLRRYCSRSVVIFYW